MFRRSTPALLAYAIPFWTGACEPEIPPEPVYVEHIAPVIDHHCTRCHHEQRATAGVRLDTAEALLSNKLAVVCSSIRVDARGGLDPDGFCDAVDVAAMPPGAIPRLSLHEQRLLTRWLEEESSP